MGFREAVMKKATGQLGENLINDMKKAQKDSDKLVKQLNSELHELAELLNQVIDSQNEIIKGVISNYDLIKAIADKANIDAPNPLITMKTE